MESLLKAEAVGNVAAATVSMRCPVCRQIALFEALGQDLRLGGPQNFVVGHRRCRAQACHTHIFVVLNGSSVLDSYPPETIDFDSSSVPSAIVETLKEAILCHANRCFIAAAIMVRKTLEELCCERGATGENLKARIKDLGSKVILPKELFSGLDDIRLLGNDAAHIESNVFNEVGQQELDVAIEFTNEVLKAIYQYSGLLKS